MGLMMMDIGFPAGENDEDEVTMSQPMGLAYYQIPRLIAIT